MSRSHATASVPTPEDLRALRDSARPLLLLDAGDRILACSRALEQRLGLADDAWTGDWLEEHVEVRSLAATPDSDGRGTGEVVVRMPGGERVDAHADLILWGQGERRLAVVVLSPAVQPRPAAPSPAADGRTTVLVVDDESPVRRLVGRILRADGYHVLEARGPAEAVAAAAGADTIHLLVTDVIMPGMSGVELSERLTRDRPQLRTLFMTGYAEEIFAAAGRREASAWLPKPFAPEDLSRRARRILERGPEAPAGD